MAVNKKAFYFTFIALFFVALFFTYMQVVELQNMPAGNLATTIQNQMLNSFIIELETFYLPAMLSVASHSAIDGLIQVIQTEQLLISENDLSAVLYESITQGTASSLTATPISTNSLDNLSNQIEQLALDELGVNVSLHFQSNYFQVYHTSPWKVTIDLIFLYSINNSDFVWQNNSRIISVNVPITGLSDPYYYYQTDYTFAPVIQPTNITEGNWTIELLYAHVKAQEYDETQFGPSFLQRLVNVTNASAFGIESLVNPDTIGFSRVNASYVDYVFWSDWNCSDAELFEIDNITQSYVDFKLQDSLVAKYVNQTEYLQNKTLFCT